MIRTGHNSPKILALSYMSTMVLCAGGGAGAFAAVPGDAAQDATDLATLRGLPRLEAELALLERDGNRVHLDAHELHALLEVSGPGTLAQLLTAVDAPLQLDERRRVLLGAALDAYPRWVLDELRAGTKQAADGLAKDALLVLEQRGTAADLFLARDLALGEDATARPDRRVARRYESALSAIMLASPAAVRSLEDHWSEWPDSLWIPTVKAIGGAASPEALDMLTYLLQEAEDAHQFLVQQIGRVAERSSLPGDFALHATLIQLAGEQRSGLRREACITLGKLHCSDAIDVLIDDLSDPDAGVREAAYWSLQHVTGKRMKAEPERWRAWYVTEERWWRDEYHDVREGLRSEQIAEVGLAIRELGRRKLRRHELALDLLPLLSDERTAVVKMTVSGLGALGSAVAVQPLIPLLDHQDGEVRQLAWRVLCSITGRDDLPPERSAWAALSSAD